MIFFPESPLQIALLTLFIELNYRFPKFIVGLITRDSVRTAFKNGITAKQITHYLSMHAHPNMYSEKRSTVIPSTIIDQIFLWEQERNRLTFCDGVLYSQFNSQTDYEALKKYAFVSYQLYYIIIFINTKYLQTKNFFLESWCHFIRKFITTIIGGHSNRS